MATVYTITRPAVGTSGAGLVLGTVENLQDNAGVDKPVFAQRALRGRSVRRSSGERTVQFALKND